MQRHPFFPPHVLRRHPTGFDFLTHLFANRGFMVETHLRRGIGLRREGRIIGKIIVEIAIAVPQDHARVQQFLKRFGRVHQPEVIQHLMPEP